MTPGARVYEVVAETLAGLGHDTVFTLLGSGNFKLVDHLVRACSGRHVWARHESAAVAAADGYAQVTRGLGVASVHQGPGLTNTLTSLTEAALERTPLLLLAAETARGQRANQAVDASLIAQAAGAGVARIENGSTAARDVARAAERAQRERLPVILCLPIDQQEEPVERGEPAEHRLPRTPRTRPVLADVEAACDLIERSTAPLVLAGRGAVIADARSALEALGDRIGALYATSLVGNGLFAGNPRSLGVCGGFSSQLAERVVPDADLILSFGASLNQWTTMHGRMLEGATLVQCDVEPGALGRHQRPDLGLVGDAAETAEALLAALEARGYRSGGSWNAIEDELRAYSPGDAYEDGDGPGPLDPRTVAVALDRHLPTERTIVYDGGHFHWFPTPYLSVPDADAFVPAQGFQSVGLGLGTAIGAATARPDRPVLALVGDGGAMMTLGELDSLVGQRLDVVVAVFNDGAYGAEVHHFGPMGLPTELVEFGDRDFTAIATALGARAATVRTPGDLADALEPWLSERGGPLVLDCKVDPGVRAERLAEAFGRGA